MVPSLLDENRFPFPNLKYLKIELEKRELWDKVDIPGSVLNFFLNSFTKLKYCVKAALIRH
ncbi:hypothetical protein COLO4_11881 [Corchorus olitorius]|uniref:Uncharacterized protein n=1 Tax=Corchorus olitorius TaxID=93759 RepID=A0A1R3K2Y4_9ROSI|nr:hypothetical protein COLO4_11881 [Corchorus olitorius]